MKNLIQYMEKQVIVSVQSVDDEPLNNAATLALMAQDAIRGGARILRVSQYEHIKAIKKITDVPLIGLIKKHYNNSSVFITPTLKEVKQLLELKVEVIALDATQQIRPKETLEEIVNYVRKVAPEVYLMADCSTLEEMVAAEKLGFDIISSTLASYTPYSDNKSVISVDFQLAKDAIRILHTPFIAEGHIWKPSQAARLLKLGSHSVVVGSALTRPHCIIEEFYKDMQKLSNMPKLEIKKAVLR